MRKYYAGIGSRSTPPEVLDQMTELAGWLEKMGWWLRSGGAQGADLAFQRGVQTNAQIWIPWPTFSADLQIAYCEHEWRCVGRDTDTDKEADASVDRFHPAPDKLSRGARLLMARNYRQIIGWNEPNSSFVICWTEGGLKKGGTAQAIKIAESLNIPVFNLFNLTPFEILDKVTYG